MAQPPRARTHRARVAIAGAVTALAVTGFMTACGGDADTTSGDARVPTPTSAAPTSAPTTAPSPTAEATRTPQAPATVAIPPVKGPHNELDIMFSSDMIPHHRQAVEMGDLARTRATDPRIKVLAQRIATAQKAEINLMSGWLKAWGQQVPPPDEMHTSHGPGMMSHAEMEDLKAAKGAAFDRMFCQMMIRHHQGALEMAGATQKNGQNLAVKALATNVVSTQTAEVDELSRLLADL